MSSENQQNGKLTISKTLSKPNILTKGLGIIPKEISEEVNKDTILKSNWNLLKEDVSLPVAVLDEKLLRSNISWMKEFLDFYKIKHCPHGKTTMSPELFQIQLNEGKAWGITLATAPQVKLAHSFGVSRVLLANQLVGKPNMEIVCAILQKDPSFEFFCIVDSVENVNQLGEFFQNRNQTLKILLEFGPVGGRTGIRIEDDITSILSVISTWKCTLQLVGVEFFEGIFREESEIRQFIQKVVIKTKELHEKKKFDRNPVILTGAGSAWFDVVAEELSQARNQLEMGKSDLNLEIILRPGCYLTHDRGLYKDIDLRMQNRVPVKSLEGKRLLPALHVWTYVQSIPEPLLAIIGFGRRDVSFDCGYPIPSLHFRSGWESPRKASSHWRVTNMMDQHTFLNLGVQNREEEKRDENTDSSISSDESLQVGDIIVFDIIHPCTTFDKWKNLLLIDDHFNTVDVFTTYF